VLTSRHNTMKTPVFGSPVRLLLGMKVKQVDDELWLVLEINLSSIVLKKNFVESFQLV